MLHRAHKTGFIDEDCLEKSIKEVVSPTIEALELQGHKALILQDNMSSHISKKVRNVLDSFDI